MADIVYKLSERVNGVSTVTNTNMAILNQTNLLALNIIIETASKISNDTFIEKRHT